MEHYKFTFQIMKNTAIGLTLFVGLMFTLTKCDTSKPLFDVGYTSQGTPQKIIIKNNTGDVQFIILKTDIVEGDSLKYNVYLNGDTIVIE